MTMPTRKASDYADKVVKIVRTYGDLHLQPGVLKSFQQDTLEAHGDGYGRFPEDEAAEFLARYLHAMVVTELRAGVDSPSVGPLLDAWSKFAQQAMYRADLGLINLVLFKHEILPRIDQVERIAREGLLADTSPRKESALRESGAPV